METRGAPRRRRVYSTLLIQWTYFCSALGSPFAIPELETGIPTPPRKVRVRSALRVSRPGVPGRYRSAAAVLGSWLTRWTCRHSTLTFALQAPRSRGQASVPWPPHRAMQGRRMLLRVGPDLAVCHPPEDCRGPHCRPQCAGASSHTWRGRLGLGPPFGTAAHASRVIPLRQLRAALRFLLPTPPLARLVQRDLVVQRLNVEGLKDRHFLGEVVSLD